MCNAMRRELSREATGPTVEEFAAEGATFLVGMIRPAYPNRLAPQFKVTPRDDWFYPYAYIDDIGVKVGDIVGDVFEQDRPVEVVQAELRTARAGRRAERRTQTASSALARWFAKEGGEINGTWSVPTEKGHGVLVEADEFALRALQEKARALAKQHRVYYSVVPGETPGEYLAAFVTEARYTPLDFASAVAIADAATDASVPMAIDKSVPGEVTVMPVEPTSAVILNKVESSGFYGDVVGNVFDKIKDAFGPKKPEKIKKKIEKLEAELEKWKGKLAEAEASEGLVIGNIYQMPGAFSSAARRAGDYGEIHDPRMFDDAEDVEYGGYDPDMFEDAEDVHYGGNLRSGLFRDAEDVDYGDVGALPSSRADLEAEIIGELREMVADGGLSQAGYARMVGRLETMSDEELAELYQDLVGDDEEAGAFPSVSTSRIDSASDAASISRKAKRKARRQARRARRRARSRRQNRRLRRAARAMRRKSKGGKRKGGGGGQQPQPQIIVIREGGGGGGGGGGDEDDYEDDYEDEDDDGSDGVGAFAYGGPGYGDAALRMGRVVDLPRSPNGYVINYPVG